MTRKDCCKGCKGPLLRSIQRFGRLGKRSTDTLSATATGGSQAGALRSGVPKQQKDPRCMYVSLDEACSHAGASAFRLVAGIYDCAGTHLLATSVSPPIR